MRLVADRFIVDDAQLLRKTHAPSQEPFAEQGRDLASGEDVRLIITSAGGPTEQLQWALRCSRYAQLHHPSIARLLDYGRLGETRRFEAWRAGAGWRGSREAASRARTACDDFLTISDLSITRDPLVAVWSNLPIIVPDAPSGLELGCNRHEAGSHRDEYLFGLESIPRPAVGAIGELLADVESREPRAVALWSERGAGLRVAVRELARLARANGIVPVHASVGNPAIWSLLQGRTAAIIQSGGQIDLSCDVTGWRRWLDASIRVARSHVLIFTSSHEVPHVQNLRLDPVSEDALVGAVRPHALAALNQPVLRQLAARSGGCPARFACSLHVSSRAQASRVFAFPRRAAESPPAYEVAASPSRPVARDVASLRDRLADAERRLQAGSHISAARVILGSTGALRRRGDHVTAARGLLSLARARLRRGHVAEARRALDEARASAHAARDDDGLLEIAVQCGHTCIDAGMLVDGEVVLRGAMATARGRNRPELLVDATLALARGLFWQGRYEESRSLVSGIDRQALCDRQLAAIAIATARAASGCPTRGGVSASAEAVRLAQQTGDGGLVARAAYTAAIAHLVAGDYDAVAADVSQAVIATRAVRDPLTALRARLVVAEANRRGGRPGAGARLLARLARLGAAPLPATVRARITLLRDLLNGVESEAVVERLSTSTGLAALRLFAPAAKQDGWALTGADWCAVLEKTHAAADERTAVTVVCEHVRVRLRAAAVACVAAHGKGFQTLAADGARLDPDLASRVLAAGGLIAWQPGDSGAEAGMPVRYGGRPCGVILARWPAGDSPDPARVEVLLSMGAAVAAPALAAIVSQLTAGTPPADGLVGASDAIAAVRQLIERAASVPFAVLVEGESGSGKELVARALHRSGPRRDRAFCAINCAALPDELFEAELFGHARGAFTGALAERTGVVEEAHGGTLFLDEVGELSLRAQAKLLRTLQEGEIRRVGENLPRRVDVRVIAATNRNLRQEVTDGRFRPDLLYRLDVIRIAVPALRERTDDLPLLIERFWQEAAARAHSRALLSAATVAALTQYPWPGNVRELQNVLAALAVRAPRRGLVAPGALPPHVNSGPPPPALRLDEARRSFEARFVRAALARAGGRRTQAAHELGISRQGLTKLLSRLGLCD